MRFLFRPFQLVLGAADDHFVTEFNELADHIPDVQRTGPSFHQGHVVDPVGGLKLGMLIQLVDHYIRHGIPFQVDDDTGAFLIIGFIVDMGNPFHDLLVHQLTYTVAEGIAVDLVGHFGDDDRLSSAGLGIDIQLTAHYDPASPEMHAGLDAFHSINNTAGRKIRRFAVLHSLIYRDIALIDISNTAIDDLRDIMRHHVRSHPNGYTAGAIDDQLGNPGRYNATLF